MRVVQIVVDLSKNVKSVVVEQHAIRAFGWHVTRVWVGSERLTANGVDTPQQLNTNLGTLPSLYLYSNE